MYSFDVFDTLITRTTASPKGIFALMQEILVQKQFPIELPDNLIRNFYQLRIGAEQLARRDAQARGLADITLPEIYRAMALTADLTREQQEALAEWEFETELRNVVGIGANIDRLKRLLEEKERVVLISDMYLSGEQIRRLLLETDPVLEKLPIYVSSQYRKTKSSGQLFRIVQQAEKADYGDWMHIGDHPVSDIRAPQRLGIKTLPVKRWKSMEYETEGSCFYEQLSVGCSKRVRENVQTDIDGGPGVAGKMGCSVGGPLLYPYICWVLQESLKKGIKRLYFIARDGWILKQIADVVIKERNYPLATKYIYGSRRAWRLPSIGENTEELRQVIRWTQLPKAESLQQLAEIFGMTGEEILPFLSDITYMIPADGTLSPFMKKDIQEKLSQSREFFDHLKESQKPDRERTIRYLREEIDTLDDAFAFVELAGTGLTQECLGRLMKSFYPGKIKTFYWKLDTVYESEVCQYYNFYPVNRQADFVVELFGRAPHGQTEGYELRNGKIVPVLEKEEGKALLKYGLEEYAAALLQYVKRLEEIRHNNGIEYPYPYEMLDRYLEMLTNNPAEEIKNYLCHMPFSSSGLEKQVLEFAPPVSRRQIKKIYFWNGGQTTFRNYQGGDIHYVFVCDKKAEKYRDKCTQRRNTKFGRYLLKLTERFSHSGKVGRYDCPKELFEGKIVVYGAGKVGREIVRCAKRKRSGCREVIWVDTSYHNITDGRMRIESPEILKTREFDRVLIAIHNAQAREEVKARLEQMGILAGRIYFV